MLPVMSGGPVSSSSTEPQARRIRSTGMAAAPATARIASLVYTLPATSRMNAAICSPMASAFGPMSVSIANDTPISA